MVSGIWSLGMTFFTMINNTCDVVKMKVTQTTAIEQMNHQVAIKLSVENDNIEIQSPELLVTNDGSNACTFLSVKIAEL